MTRIFAIETSCDETAAAIVEDGRHLLSNVVATQIDLHRRYGGVFPEVASRQHVLAMPTVMAQALQEAGVESVRDLDALAVTHGPGLAGSLLVGVNAAKGTSFASGLPLLPVNHLEGHIYSNWIRMDGGQEMQPGDDFPILVLIVSHGRYRRLGGTLDDAAGEAFDKVARLLELGYPGGPAIQEAAMAGDPGRYPLPRPLATNEAHRFNFSYSGLKTAVLNLLRQLAAEGVDVHAPQVVADVAASFQAAAVEGLVDKTAAAAQALQAGLLDRPATAVRRVCICGGVSANRALREAARARFQALGLPLHIPPLALCTDNAAMIAAAAYFRWRALGEQAVGGLDLDVYANLPLVEEPVALPAA
jgi:N6-L-threonylcarbamoyladenine synthase